MTAGPAGDTTAPDATAPDATPVGGYRARPGPAGAEPARDHRRAGGLRVLARPAAGWLRRHPWAAAWLAFAPVPVLRAGTLAESDTFWQVRTGLVTIAQHAIPAVDTFSWTMRGKPWTLNSWGFNVAIALAYRVIGLPGVAWACAGMVMVVAALVLLLARQLGASPVIAGACLLLASPMLVGWLTARPQLADYAAVLVLVMVLRRIADGRDRLRGVAAAGVLSAVWVNVHAGTLAGVAIAAACAAIVLASPGRRTRGLWCLAASVAALGGSFLNPYGVGIIGQTAQVQADSSGLIVEWQHVNPASPLQDMTLAVGAWALVIAVRRRDPALTAALAVCSVGAVLAIRMLPFVAVIGAPVIAARLSAPGPALLRYARSRRVMFARCGTAGLVAFGAVAIPSLTHIGRPDLAKYPVTIVRDIPSGCRVFTTDLIGGYVILERPDAPVSLDTRNTLYGRDRLLALERVLRGRVGLARGLAGAGCVLVPPGSGLARSLASDGGWRLIASDPPAAVLFVRT